ncbi:hypothetical protein D3C75_1070530 [compost metagenome]
MADADPGFGNEHGDLRGHFLDSLDTVIEIIDLSTPGQFAFHRLADKRLAVFHHIRLYRETVLRRRLNNGQVPHTEH